MKNKVILLSIMSLFTIGNVMAQEYDDMYFNKKDRTKLKAESKTAISFSDVKKKKLPEDESYALNPTDSYSSRNVNPEYTSRANSQIAQADNEDYFVSSYRYGNSYSNWNNNFNNWYNNPWYTSAYWGPRLSNWNSPYYGYYDSWGSPWGNPYYNSGWNNSFYFGNSWSSGWGYGMNNGWGSPWSSFGMCPYWGSASYAYSPYAGWYRAPTVVVVDRNSGGVVYGKRTSRSSGIVSNNISTSQGRTYSNNGSNSRSDRNGRISTSSTRQSAYYEPVWRNQSRSSSSEGNSGRTSTWNNSNSRSSSRESTPGYSAPSRSSEGTGSRSSGSNSNSGSRSSRGRGN